MTTVAQKVDLYFTQGSSDKHYQVLLLQADGGFQVQYGNGRRGSTLRTGMKTPTPLEREAAQAIFDKVVREKTKKGYTEEASGESFTSVNVEQNKTEFEALLLTPTTMPEMHKRILSVPHGTYWYQRKYDGERRYVKVENGNVIAANRNGLEVGIPQELASEFVNGVHAQGIKGACEFDCEDLGSNIIVFDVLRWNGQDLRNNTLAERLSFINQSAADTFEYCSRIFVERLKSVDFNLNEAIEAYRRTGAEGVVFKDGRAIYTPGVNPAYLKFKFKESASLVVIGHNEGKRSVRMGLYNESTHLTDVGSVSIPVNTEIPRIGAIIEVEYLYAYKGGSLYQPTYKIVRNDIAALNCTVTQLKYKTPETPDVEAVAA